MDTPAIQDGIVSIDALLSKVNEKTKSYKSIEVHKEVDPVVDVGSLLLSDKQPINVAQLRKDPRGQLDGIARDNCQLLFNEIWKLPVERIEDAIVVKLPAPSTLLPREKPVPKSKPLTKWEKFAKDKGILKKKRGRMVWDEQAKEWKPRYGYKRTDDDKEKWLIEVPQNADPYEDQFDKRAKEKKERIAKNELQRLRNIAKRQKSGKGTVMSTEFKPSENKGKERLQKEIEIAKVSTASVGKFQPKLAKEKDGKRIGMKRKFDPVVGSSEGEKKKALEIWERLHKPPPIDINKAVNRHQTALESTKREKPTKKAKGGKKGGRSGGKLTSSKRIGKSPQGRKARSLGSSKKKPGGKRR